MTSRRVHIDQLKLRPGPDWMDSLIRQLERAIGDRRAAEQAARAIVAQLPKEAMSKR